VPPAGSPPPHYVSLLDPYVLPSALFSSDHHVRYGSLGTRTPTEQACTVPVISAIYVPGRTSISAVSRPKHTTETRERPMGFLPQGSETPTMYTE
jgi:hypothetical protein